MNVKIISKLFCNCMDSLCPRDDTENEVIQYGLELVLDTLLKLLFLIAVGSLLGKGKETLIILGVFCGLRLQAGGAHAETSTGCTVCMGTMWGGSLMGYLYLPVSNIILIVTYIVSFYIVMHRAPQTGHIEYFTKEIIQRKKICAVLLLTAFIVIAFLNKEIRGLFIYPVILEVLSLLPGKYKTKYEEV